MASLKVAVQGAVGRVWQATPMRVRGPVRVERRWAPGREAEPAGGERQQHARGGREADGGTGAAEPAGDRPPEPTAGRRRG
eukprot:6649026-Alexandrium_andersonii.AAC.1